MWEKNINKYKCGRNKNKYIIFKMSKKIKNRVFKRSDDKEHFPRALNKMKLFQTHIEKKIQFILNFQNVIDKKIYIHSISPHNNFYYIHIPIFIKTRYVA